MAVRFLATIRGVEIEVTADSFDGDPSVGIPYFPEEIYAYDLDGKPFNLTDSEMSQLGIQALEIMEHDYYD